KAARAAGLLEAAQHRQLAERAHDELRVLRLAGVVAVVAARPTVDERVIEGEAVAVEELRRGVAELGIDLVLPLAVGDDEIVVEEVALDDAAAGLQDLLHVGA